VNESLTRNLLERAAAGEQDAAGELIRRFERPLRVSIRRRLGPELRARVDTDDIFQETSVQAVHALPGFRYSGDRALLAWLAALAERQIQNAARLHRAGKRSLRLERALRESGTYPSPHTSPTQSVARDERTMRLHEAVDRLPEPERTVVRLHSFEGRSFGSIARDLSMTDWSAARRVFLRALRSLGDMLVS
jgi:RNA polymerase sigma-70 factor (ECF subfamily)